MDDLYACYQSYMRLYPDDPDRLTLGRWLWCPEGAEALPFPTAFCSSRYDPNDWELQGVGELPEIQGYCSGKANPRYRGLTHCGSAHLFAVGSPVIQRGTPAADADGVPLCCDAAPAVGGEALGGEGTVVSTGQAALWWMPEGLDTYALGDGVTNWPDASNSGRFGYVPLLPVHQPIVTNGPGGLRAGLFNNLTAVAFLALPATNLAAYMVVTVLGSGSQRVMPVVGSDAGPGRQGLIGSGTGIFYVDTVNTVDGLAAVESLQTHIWSWRRTGDQVSLYKGGDLLASATIDPAGHFNFDAVALFPPPIPRTGTALLSELAIFPGIFTDSQDAMMLAYLKNKYGIDGGDNVPTGTIIHMALDSTPAGGYLACDGSAYLESDYPVLAAYLAGAYDTYRGAAAPAAGEFRVPDLRGLVLIGGGSAGTDPDTSAYAVGDTGGEETHQLVTSELASHSHTMTLPQSFFASGAPQPQVPAGMSHDADQAFAGDATGGDVAHNNLQPYGVGFPFIKT